MQKEQLLNNYFHLLKKVNKPGRYIGGEINQIVKQKFDIHFCLAFPDTYEIGMSHLGLRILYHYLNSEKDIFTERVFAPWPDFETQLRDHHVPLLSLETKTPLSEFDAIGFSLQYQLEYTNVLTILSLANIPIRSAERVDQHPIILAGGPVVFNPEPMAPFIDAFVIGDGEKILPQLLRLIKQSRNMKIPRPQLLNEMAKFEGVYVPALYSHKEEKSWITVQSNSGAPYPIPKTVLEDINDYPFPGKIIVPHTDIVHNRISIEIARGCTQGCRFCQAGFIYRPVRERSPASILQSIFDSIRDTGYKDVSLTSLSPADYSVIGDFLPVLVDMMEQENIAFHLSSLRVYGLSQEIAEALSRGRKTGFTIAPEAGTQRMRDIINKNITEEDILKGAENAFRNGWELIKLYTMIGLPGETEEDVEGIAHLAEKVLSLGESIIGKRARVNLAVSTFVPQPFTPFQWAPFLSKDEFEHRKSIIINRLKPYKRIKFNFNDYLVSLLEAVFSRGDSSMADIIQSAWEKGARFDGWNEIFRREVWESAISHLNFSRIPQMVGFDENTILPWEHIHTGITKSFLLKEWNKAQKAQTTAPCEQPNSQDYTTKKELVLTDKPYVCYQCGLSCDTEQIRKEHQQFFEYIDSLKETAKQAKVEAKPTRNVVLFRFSKKAPIHMLSHLNLIQVLIRLFNRVNLPIAYSEGYKPKPKLYLAKALALGVESEDEWGQAEVECDFNESELLTTLNNSSPEGITFLEIKKLDKKVKFHEYFVFNDYEIKISESKNNSGNILQLLQQFSSKPECIVIKTDKKGQKEIDFKPFIRIKDISESDQQILIQLELKSPQSGSVKLSDFLEIYLGLRDDQYHILKTGSYPRLASNN